MPRTVTSRAVRSYRTLSPLPDPACAGHRRFALCCTGRGFPPQALPGTLPYGARTFLPSARLPPKEDDDEAATVWSASARSIVGLPPVVIPLSSSRPAGRQRYCATHEKYCPTRAKRRFLRRNRGKHAEDGADTASRLAPPWQSDTVAPGITTGPRRAFLVSESLPLSPAFRSNKPARYGQRCPDRPHAAPASSPLPPPSAAAERPRRGRYPAHWPDL